ncbi:Beta-fructofuranosidase, soluble isoenzyme I [Dionaea muscipula]
MSSSSSDMEQNDPHSSYKPLLGRSITTEPVHFQEVRRRPVKGFTVVIGSCSLFLLSLILLILNGHEQHSMPELTEQEKQSDVPAAVQRPWRSRAEEQGVSEKSFQLISDEVVAAAVDDNGTFPWTNVMLSWQRTGYHFQPQKNWMNDPDGPLFHKGWYHLFYQYNPDSAIWGNITWGHAVSNDLIHWLYLPLAMVPDRWFDWNGVWTGSSTILPDGNIVIIYTGDTNNYVQVQNLAYPANISDPLLLDWVKYDGNPVMTPPEGIALKDFRDPTTAWQGPDGVWRVMIGSKKNGAGIALVYKTTNFTTYELVDHVAHAVAGTGMWECVDFYPVSTTSPDGLDWSANGPGIKHVLKASLDDNKHDYYALGTYDSVNDTWTPDDPEVDVGIGLRVDYGKYYASKTFYDQDKGRRILWGWVGETDTDADDLLKGWACVQTIPRVVTFDNKTGTNIIQWPVEEVESLRSNSSQFDGVFLEPGSVVELNVASATQLDITAEFEVDKEALNNATLDEINNCSTSSFRGATGPFGLLVLTDETFSELTPVYFYVGRATDGTIKTWFCTDKSRSTIANDVDKQVYGGLVPVLEDENFSLRILVDHSVVEAFGQGGRTCITSRIYPTQAIYGAAKVFLFNNATDLNVTASVEVWHLDSADIHPFPLDQV